MPPPSKSALVSKKQPLHLLCCSKSAVALEAVRSRLGRGDDPRARSEDGMTPLHVAAAYDSLAICQLLLHYGADPLAQDDLGRTPLSMATGTSKIFLDRHLMRDIRARRGILRRLFMCHSGATQEVQAKVSPSERRSSFIRNVKDRVRQSVSGVMRRRRETSNSDPTPIIPSTGLYPRLSPVPATPAYQKAPVRRRARTPDALQTPSRPVQTPRRSKTPDFDPAMGRTPRTVTGAAGTARGRIAAADKAATTAKGNGAAKTAENRRGRSKTPDGKKAPISSGIEETPKKYERQPKKQPTAPPLTPEEQPKRAGGKTASKDVAGDKRVSESSAYMTADESFELKDLETRLNQLKITLPATPTTVDESHLRRIRRLKDNQLRDELKKVGIHPGPICSRTRHMYEKKLLCAQQGVLQTRGSIYSRQLELAFKGVSDEKTGKQLDEQIRSEFQSAGVTAFVYLLIDPRVLGEVDKCTLKTFVEAIFYVGKGTKARPLAHLIDAKRMREIKSPKLETNAKLQRIDSIWRTGSGVILLEISHTISDHEAFIREAAFFEAIKMENLTNIKGGEWHGSSRTWDSRHRAELGVYLLQQAMGVLRTMGARPVHPDSLPETVYPNVTQRKR